MKDKELLELAAKAHGFIDDATDESAAHGLHRSTEGDFYIVDANGWHPWVPQDDDGDALRLAVKLKMHVIFDDENAEHPQASAVNWRGETKAEYHYDDPCAATRRAIFRAAAAEIGKGMQ